MLSCQPNPQDPASSSPPLSLSGATVRASPWSRPAPTRAASSTTSRRSRRPKAGGPGVSLEPSGRLACWELWICQTTPAAAREWLQSIGLEDADVLVIFGNDDLTSSYVSLLHQ
jgi:hypothetical protein